MRVIAALGALCFAYLAVIPGAVVGATIDSACAGSSCEYSQPITVYLVIAFGATTLALAGSALSLALFSLRPSPSNGRNVRGCLKASAVLTGVVLLSELALPDPVATLVIVALTIPVALIGAARRSDTSIPGRPPGAGTRRAPG